MENTPSKVREWLNSDLIVISSTYLSFIKFIYRCTKGLQTMIKKLKRRLFKFLPKYFSFFPLILSSQEDIFKAEDSGTLSHALRADGAQLPSRLFYLKSLFLEHWDLMGQQLLFYPMTEKYSGPMSEKRIATGLEIKKKLDTALSELKSMNDSSSVFLRYMHTEQNNGLDHVSDVNTLETMARIELLSLVIKQFNSKLIVDHRLIKCIDDLSPIFFQQTKIFIYADRERLAIAKKNMESLLSHDPDLFHNALQIGTTLWRILQALRIESRKPKFKRMLRRGKWSPASFIAQHLKIDIRLFRLTTCETNLDGVLNYTLEPGRLVTFNPLVSAIDANGLFNRACCGGNFIMELLTFLVDYLNPGLRPVSESKCPYRNKISRPLY